MMCDVFKPVLCVHILIAFVGSLITISDRKIWSNDCSQTPKVDHNCDWLVHKLQKLIMIMIIVINLFTNSRSWSWSWSTCLQTWSQSWSWLTCSQTPKVDHDCDRLIHKLQNVDHYSQMCVIAIKSDHKLYWPAFAVHLTCIEGTSIHLMCLGAWWKAVQWAAVHSGKDRLMLGLRGH